MKGRLIVSGRFSEESSNYTEPYWNGESGLSTLDVQISLYTIRASEILAEKYLLYGIFYDTSLETGEALSVLSVAMLQNCSTFAAPMLTKRKAAHFINV